MIMKLIKTKGRECFFLVVFALLKLTANAQSDSIFKKHEINFGGILNGSSKYSIGYKYHLKSGAIRLNLAFSYSAYKDSSTYNNSGALTKMEYKTISVPTSIGYEWRKNFGKSFLFFGADLSYIFNNENRITSYQTWDTTIYISTGKTHTIGLSPFIGVEYSMNKRFSISTQLKLDAYYYKGRSKDFNPDNLSATTYHNIEGFNFDFGPISVIIINIYL